MRLPWRKKKKSNKTFHPSYYLKDTISAFSDALWICRAYGLNWKESIRPMHRNNILIGYYVLDETLSTAIVKLKIDEAYGM